MTAASVESEVFDLLESLAPPCTCLCHEHEETPPAEWVLHLVKHPSSRCTIGSRVELFCTPCKERVMADGIVVCPQCRWMAQGPKWIERIEPL